MGSYEARLEVALLKNSKRVNNTFNFFVQVLLNIKKLKIANYYVHSYFSDSLENFIKMMRTQMLKKLFEQNVKHTLWIDTKQVCYRD